MCFLVLQEEHSISRRSKRPENDQRATSEYALQTDRNESKSPYHTC